MARVPLMALAGLLSLLVPVVSAHAQALPQDVAADGILIPDMPDGKRSYAQSAMTKIRPGSALQGPDQVLPQVRTPGTLGERRDTLVRRHYSHMAELDVLSDQALRARDVASAERAEAMRRRDTQAFFLNMQALRRLLLKQQAEAGP